MHINRRVISCLAHQRYNPLRFTQGVGTNHMAAVWKATHTVKELFNFQSGVGMLKNRQTKSRLGHKNIAFNWFKRQTGAVTGAFIVTRDHDALFIALKKNLSAS